MWTTQRLSEALRNVLWLQIRMTPGAGLHFAKWLDYFCEPFISRKNKWQRNHTKEWFLSTHWTRRSISCWQRLWNPWTDCPQRRKSIYSSKEIFCNWPVYWRPMFWKNEHSQCTNTCWKRNKADKGLEYFQSSSASFQLWLHKSDLDCVCIVNQLSKSNHFCLKELFNTI